MDCVNATESQVQEELCKATKAMEETITNPANVSVELNGQSYKSLQGRIEENNSIVEEYKNEAEAYANQARADKEYIENYSIPTEAIDKTQITSLVSSLSNGVSGLVDRELDLEISETNGVVGLKNRYAKFEDKLVDLYDENGNYKSIDLAPSVPNVQIETSTTTSASVNSGDYVVMDRYVSTATQTAETSNTIEVDDGTKFTVGTKIFVKPTSDTSYTDTIVSIDTNTLTLTTSRTKTAEDYEVKVVEEIFRNETEETIPAGTSLYDSRFKPRPYISNQILLTLKQDSLGAVTLHKQIAFNDKLAVETQKSFMERNGFVEIEHGLYSKGTDKYIPIGLWQSLNKGAYHPVFNFAGCRRWIDGIDNNDWNDYWWELGSDSPETTSTTNSFIDGNTTTVGYNVNTGGYTQLTGRPDNKSYDVVYKNQLIPLYNSIQEDTEMEREKRYNSYVNGSYKSVNETVVFQKFGEDNGRESASYKYNDSLWRIDCKDAEEANRLFSVGDKVSAILSNGIKYINISGIVSSIPSYDVRITLAVPAENTDIASGTYLKKSDGWYVYTNQKIPILSYDKSLIVDLIGDPSPYQSSDTTSALQSTSTDTGTELRQNALVWNVSESQMYKYLDTDDRDNVDLTVEDFTDTAKWQKVYKGYPQSWLDRLSEGKSINNYSNLVNVNDGSSLIPDDSKTTFLISKKAKEVLQVLKSSDNGATWSVESPTIDYIENTITFGTAPASVDIILVSYITKNTLKQSSPKPIKWVSAKEINTNSHSIYQGAMITNSQGHIATGDGSRGVEDKTLENKIIDENGNLITSPEHQTPALDNSNSKASKAVYAIAEEDGSLFEQIFVQELVKDGSDNYNSTKFDNLDNGTTLDDVGITVKTNVFINELPYKAKK